MVLATSGGAKIHSATKLRGRRGGDRVRDHQTAHTSPPQHKMNGPVDRVYHFSDDYEPRKKSNKSKRNHASRNNDIDMDTQKDRDHKLEKNAGPIKRLPPPPGLKNVGNSCYANAALQCLLSTALPHALLSERNAHIIRRHSFNRRLLVSGSGSVDSNEDEGSKDADDSVFESYLSGMTGLCSLEDEEGQSKENNSLTSPGGKRKKLQPRRDDASAASYGSLTSDMYNVLKKRTDNPNQVPSEADLLCLWLTQELTQITREYTTPTPNLNNSVEEKRRSKGGNGFMGIFGSISPTNNTVQNRVVDPGSITRHVHKISPTLRPYQQEDAHEFFRSLLSSLTMHGSNARLSSLFDGLLESSVTCHVCRKSSLTRDRYMDLSLDIADRNVVSLDKALAKFTEKETLDNDNMVTCSRCKVKRPVTKALRLATAPTMLVINYKRFAYDMYGRLSRLSKQVTFPLRLELKDYMSRANRSKPPPYALMAVLVHRGRSCDCGHYFAYVRKGKDWYLANDSIVTKVDVEEVLSARAYVLVYEVEGMKEKHNFDCYSRYHRPRHDGEDENKGRSKQVNRESDSSWDFSALANLFEACEVGLCSAANSVIASPGGSVDATASSTQHRHNNFNTYEDTCSSNESFKTKQRKKSLEDIYAQDAKERDLVQAYYKRGRSHTPSTRENRKREKAPSTSPSNSPNMDDYETQTGRRHRRAMSVSRADSIKSSSRSNNSVKRYTKARAQRKKEEDARCLRPGELPPLHITKRGEV